MRTLGTLQAVIFKTPVVYVLVAQHIIIHMQITGFTAQAAIVQGKQLFSSHACARMEMDGMEGTLLSRKMARSIAQGFRMAIPRENMLC